MPFNYLVGDEEDEGFLVTLGFEPVRIGVNLRLKEMKNNKLLR